MLGLFIVVHPIMILEAIETYLWKSNVDLIEKSSEIDTIRKVYREYYSNHLTSLFLSNNDFVTSVKTSCKQNQCS